MIKAILFDMDGLMIDSERVTYDILKDLLQKQNLTLTLEMYLELVGKTKKTCIDIFKKWYGENYDYVGNSQVLTNLLNQSLIEHLPIKEGLWELIAYCQKNHYKTCIATSSYRPRLEAILPKELWDSFDETICGDEVENGKPNPEVFLKACQKLNVLPEEALVLEDSDAGIEASFNGHIPCICVPDLKVPDETHQRMVLCVCTNLKEVIPFLEKNSVL